jgi:hypothetical protein
LAKRGSSVYGRMLLHAERLAVLHCCGARTVGSGLSGCVDERGKRVGFVGVGGADAFVLQLFSYVATARCSSFGKGRYI